MKHKVRVSVIDKKIFPELQQQYCAVRESGKCPCYNVGDVFEFRRDEERDDFWHMGAGTLIKEGQQDEGCLQSPGTMHCGKVGVPFCSEAWDAISRYIYTGLQGGSIMKGWMAVEQNGEQFYIEKVAFKDWHVSLHNFYVISDRLCDGHTECVAIIQN